ncbi:acyl-CoA thioesterase [Janibacter sp. G1551]|uniref:acyl-CoA thioesterase n=1 Tax=Janibacter sp. G1551 TaxID=3420440 RepID=UPI003CFC0647
MATLTEALTVTQAGPGRYVGSAPETRMQRTFGGLVAGQAMVAAVATVDPAYAVHSLHGYFLRPGVPHLPITFEVEEVRDGRAFSIRRITGHQRDRAIFTMSASFHVAQHGPTHQDQMPDVPGPDDVDPVWGRDSEYHEILRSEWPDWQLRLIPSELTTSRPGQASRQQIWFRNTGSLPDDPLFHVCALTYMSDMTLLSAALAPHRSEPIEGASLDHALWFLRPFRADDWLLYDQTSPSAGRGRALTQGRIYDQSGAMVASVTQEGLMRTPAPPA